MKIQSLSNLNFSESTLPRADKKDLQVLNSLFEKVKIAGIGESAHFVQEFSVARILMIQYLIEEHGFKTIALECNSLQAARLSVWLNDDSEETVKPDSLTRFSGPLTSALYGTVLVWLKEYVRLTSSPVELLGADLPNTLSPVERLKHLKKTVCKVDQGVEPELHELAGLLAPVTGESAVMSVSTWDSIGQGNQDRAISIVVRLRLRFEALLPVFREELNGTSADEILLGIRELEANLETLRTMSRLFSGTSIDGETSVRDYFMAKSVMQKIQSDTSRKIILLAHNNHIQKTEISFSGELTGVPCGQHLAALAGERYRAIGFTHLGDSVPEMDFPAPQSPTGFTVTPIPADAMQKDSIETHFQSNAANRTPQLALLNRNGHPEGAQNIRRMRSQSASVFTNINEAFDAVICSPQATQDKSVNF